MPRGGRRAGAGRRSVLTDMERFAIGARCEERWRAAAQANEDAAIAKATPRVQQEWAKARAVPVSERKAWLSSYAGREHLDDVEFALREDQRIEAEDELEAARHVRIRVKRPKGQRQRIIEAVAADESVRRGVRISARMVERCWKEFRAVQRSL